MRARLLTVFAFAVTLLRQGYEKTSFPVPRNTVSGEEYGVGGSCSDGTQTLDRRRLQAGGESKFVQQAPS